MIFTGKSAPIEGSFLGEISDLLMMETPLVTRSFRRCEHEYLLQHIVLGS